MVVRFGLDGIGSTPNNESIDQQQQGLLSIGRWALFLLNVYTVIKRVLTMSKRNGSSRNSFGNFQPINLDFSVEEKLTISDWIANRSADVISILIGAVESGFKLSISYSDQYNSYTVSFTDKRPTKSAKKAPVYMMRHGDAEKLLGIAAWVYVEALQQGESELVLDAHDMDW